MPPIEDLARRYKYNLAWRERNFLDKVLNPRRRWPLSDAQEAWLEKLTVRLRAMEAGKVPPRTREEHLRRAVKREEARRRQLEEDDDGWRDPEPYEPGPPRGEEGRDWHQL